ncbi:MAG: two-component sensor histidine kinase [Clostridiales bacterium]|nr:two-component sensor histidine kinase [Clostridiales bacterium]
MSLKMEKQNKELIEKQDYEVNLATITERNRIARDIHDNVGHLLSRSILQVGALLAINKDKSTVENLTLVKDTLSEAMDTVRASVHDLHEEAVDLQNEIQKLVDSFTFCPISFYYDVNENVDKNIKYCFIAVVKEALSNIMKHSNAKEVSITIVEHPAIHQLIIKDNGTKASYDKYKGIGIQNITDRVTALDGNIHISTENGFRIFISIPKSLT